MQMEELGIVCKHILSIGVPISKYCIHVKYWKIFNFHYLRDGTKAMDNLIFEKLLTCTGVVSDLLGNEEEYPKFSHDDITLSMFETVKQSPHPMIKN